MTIGTKRAKEIDAYVKSHSKSKIKYERVPIHLSGEIQKLDVYRLPIELLVYNIRNGRFAAELIARERGLKRKLHATHPDDAKIIQELLLSQSPSETENLKGDLAKHGQLQPGIITFDGAVINGNRRMAILTLLSEETGEAQFGYLRAGRLPKSVSQKDLWRIEAGLQFASDFRLKYGPINELLKLREGRKQGLTPKDISASLFGRWSEKDVNERIEVLKHIDNYLAYIGTSGQYDQVESSIEKFNSLANNVLRPLNRKGMSKPDQAKMIMVAFNLIRLTGRNKVSHWKIRELRNIADLKRAKSEVMKAQNVKDPTKTDLEELHDAFETAIEMVKDESSKENPARLLRDALSALQSIDKRSPRMRDSRARALLAQLDGIIKSLKQRAGAP